MKKNRLKRNLFYLILSLTLVLFLLNFVSGLSSNLDNSNKTFSQGETMIIQINGNILSPIMKSQVEFRRGHVITPFDYDIQKIGNTYYIWAITPFIQNNYTLNLKDVSTTVNGFNKIINYSANFIISNKSAEYSVRPGVIYTSNNFEIDLRLNTDLERTVSINFPSER